MKRHTLTALSIVSLVAVALAIPACDDYDDNPFDNNQVEERTTPTDVRPLEQDTDRIGDDDSLNLNAPDTGTTYEADRDALNNDTGFGTSSQSGTGLSTDEALGTTATPQTGAAAGTDWRAQEGSADLLNQANMQTIELRVSGLKFQPERITATPGQKIRVELINSGNANHNVEFHLADGEKLKFPADVLPGERGSLTITAPQQPGEYLFYCPVDDHGDQGMTGTLIVEAEGQSSTQTQDQSTTPGSTTTPGDTSTGLEVDDAAQDSDATESDTATDTGM